MKPSDAKKREARFLMRVIGSDPQVKGDNDKAISQQLIDLLEDSLPDEVKAFYENEKLSGYGWNIPDGNHDRSVLYDRQKVRLANQRVVDQETDDGLVNEFDLIESTHSVTVSRQVISPDCVSACHHGIFSMDEDTDRGDCLNPCQSNR
tara:strand:- start:407 stop:853 length:447 start_codon:yes stop_codon:yes gene_type:complete